MITTLYYRRELVSQKKIVLLSSSHIIFTHCSNSLTSFQVRRQGPKSVRFKQAALRLLDGLARDVLQPARKEGYIKIATIVEDTADARTPWTSRCDTDYNEKFGWFQFLSPLPFHHPLSRALCSRCQRSFVPCH